MAYVILSAPTKWEEVPTVVPGVNRPDSSPPASRGLGGLGSGLDVGLTRPRDHDDRA
jgi:hypothetical protein